MSTISSVPTHDPDLEAQSQPPPSTSRSTPSPTPPPSTDSISYIQILPERRISLQDIELPSIKRQESISHSPPIRFHETDEEYKHLQQLASEIFSTWDIVKDGIITLSEIEQSGIDKDFALALSRVLDYDGSGIIHYNDFVNCLNVLMNGGLHDKLQLLLKFLNKSNDNDITSDEAEIFLKFAPYELCAKLGLVESKINGKRKKVLTCNDLISLFEKSDRGEEAINIFCEQIIRILKKPVKHQAQHMLRHSVTLALQCGPWMSIRKLFNIEKSSIFIFVLICLQITLWIYNFMYYRQRDYPLAFSVAKGSGLNLRILSLILFLSMMRTFMGALYSYSTFRRFIPMGFNIQIHSFCGFSVVLHSFIHMGGHIVYHERFVQGGFRASFLQPSLLRGASWDDKGIGDGITGYILMGGLLLMAVTALFRSYGSKAYGIFSLTHFFYTVWFVLLFLHVPHLWPYFVTVGVMFFLERLYDFFHLTIHSTLAYSRPGSNGVTFLSVPRAGTRVFPGSYYRIKVPAISPVEWHPFSLASSVASHHLTFFVASSGDWTRELYRLVSDASIRDEIVIQVQGPFVAPAYTVSKKSTELNVLVASGIGITPFFSLMATKVAEEQNYESDRQVYASLFHENIDHRGGSFTSMKALKQWGFLQTPLKTVDIERLHVIWSVREVSELLFYLNYVSELVKYQQSFEHPVVFVDVYLTGLGKSTDLQYMMAQTLLILSLSSRTSDYMKIHFGRPDLKDIVSKLSPRNVYYCGGKVLKDSLRNICFERNIKFHPEDFDSGGSMISEVIEKVKSLVTAESKATTITRVRSRRMSVTRMPSTVS